MYYASNFKALEACVKNCGRRFHQEIGKFRFLNEVIKVVSPKVCKKKNDTYLARIVFTAHESVLTF